MLTRDSRPRLAAKARLRLDRISGRYLIVYPERGMELDPIAGEIVRRCDGQRSIAEIAVELQQQFAGADAATIEQDVIDLLNALADRCLGEPTP
jgi:coenzyme PQQ biosynthesis protein PqqD